MIYEVIVFLPLFGAIFSGFFSRFMGKKLSEIFPSGTMVIVAFLSWIVFYKVCLSSENFPVIKHKIFNWIDYDLINVYWGLRIDALTSLMFVVINSISAVVHIYSIGYMHDDKHRQRFFSYLSFFTFAMLVLVSSDNLLQMFFGWEGVGLASYLLIGFWSFKESALKASMKAFVVNRIGDIGLIIAISMIFYLFGSFEFDVIFNRASEYWKIGDLVYTDISSYKSIVLFGMKIHAHDAISIICFLLFLGAMGKSAQFLLHVWLPDAMEGPTPVSALIHAATMVTAGIFLVVRMSYLFELSPVVLDFIMIIGSITAFFAATVAMVQNDIKRVIAYSTCSQLGYMFVSLGCGAYGASVFHLFTHAFFKALLFLGAGCVIHSVSGEQDMRRMGGLYKDLPVTCIMIIIGVLALIGFGIPDTNIGFSGYFSKDLILKVAYMSSYSFIPFSLLLISALFTSFYSWRLVFLTFFGKSRVDKNILHKIHESPLVMHIPLFILGIGSIFFGFVFHDYFFGSKYHFFWKKSIFSSQNNHILETFHNIPIWLEYIPSLAIFIGFFIAFIMYIISPNLPRFIAEKLSYIYNFFQNAWYFDRFYDFIFVRSALGLGDNLSKRVERSIDKYGPDGIAYCMRYMFSFISRLQTGYIYNYAFAMLIGISILVILILFKVNIW
ncbi:NADH-quinone oxidoreductase subunit L [Candidatus Liberibacter americanus]|uniref:NADH-ubiquinone oxidoreductase chain 5 n=1 Tax=Candidatus Liberibacter americanus str. Sao Paulo TaxID=1261131 RepID=U6B7T3_9HYPH|nr:NADH-quinone oxidoreductase subunit L [Candidatus Liberibacter americanus]AHA27921.1 NADH-ubiquinone oxidoreductase chain L [Candidatus Liberibacter americanus str. Sao Paulo]EMS36080.1 NADH dehydrogenase subunit L [Candidatus Liberibacter americanus PW_SP]